MALVHTAQLPPPRKRVRKTKARNDEDGRNQKWLLVLQQRKEAKRLPTDDDYFNVFDRENWLV